MLVDVGNTSTAFGLARANEAPRQLWRIRTNASAMPDDLRAQMHALWRADFAEDFPRAAAFSSVVQPFGRNLREALEKSGVRVTELAATADHGLSIELSEPMSVGADRLCNLFGVQERLQDAGLPYAIVVDFGTSTNFDVIGAPNRFLGGVLATGPQVSAEALFARAPRLPRVPLLPPQHAIGKNTAEALQSGMVFGHVDMIDGLLRRIRAELDGPALAVATGGFAEMVGTLCHEIDAVDELLTLQGLLRFWQLQSESGEQ